MTTMMSRATLLPLLLLILLPVLIHGSVLQNLLEIAERIVGAASPSLSFESNYKNAKKENVLKLELTKPLGFILDADTEEEAIVFSLDDKYPGAAQQLSKQVQQDLVGRRVISVNGTDVSHLNLLQVAERIVASDSPVTLEFAIVVNEDNDDDDVLELVLEKPLGLILDDATDDEAIVYSLNKDNPGAAHKLTKQVQEQLVGRRIVSVNGQDMSGLSLKEVVERIHSSDSPVTLEFELVDDDDEDDDDDGPWIEFYDDHLEEPIRPLEVSLLKWKDNHDVIDPYAARVGLPHRFVPTIQAYAKRLKIIKGLTDVLYNNPCDPEDGRYYQTDNPHLANNDLPFLHHQSLQWYAQRPGSHWNSDMHWFAGSDERTHESMLRMLAEGGIDEVLDAIGNYFDLDGLFVQSVGFLGVTHCEEGFLHDDFKDVDGKFFNLLIPVTSPEDAGPEVNVAGRRNVTKYPTIGRKTEDPIIGTAVKYDSSYGLLVGDRALHGTRECDHRAQGGIRVMLSVYIADIHEHNVHAISYDTTAIFPVPEMPDWLWSQKGRHWGRDMCMNPDIGRRAFPAVDNADRCGEAAKHGLCESSSGRARRVCPQSCKVYMEDWEYRPGVERSLVMGDFDFDVSGQYEE